MSITIAQDQFTPERFGVAGKRITGTVHASISIEDNRHYTWNRDEPEQWVNVHVSTRDGSLTVNGVEYTAGMTVRMNGVRPLLPVGASVSRKGKHDYGDATPAARDAAYTVAELVAQAFYTPEREHDARVANAQRAANDAAEQVREALAKAKAADDALQAARDARAAALVYA